MMMGKPRYRNELEQLALTRLEQTILAAHETRRHTLYYPVMAMEVPDLERLLYYIGKLEYELDYRDAVANMPPLTRMDP